jgi:hypothetical protein
MKYTEAFSAAIPEHEHDGLEWLGPVLVLQMISIDEGSGHSYASTRQAP